MKELCLVAALMIALVSAVVAGSAWAGPDLPSEEERDILIVSTLLRFNDANRGHNYALLRGLASHAFQEKLSEEKLSESFKVFRRKNVRLDEVAIGEIQAGESGELMDGGVLQLAGRMDLSQFQINYAMKFIYERDEWKLLFLEVNVN